MHRLVVIFSFILLLTAEGLIGFSVSEAAFFQLATTTKRPGAAPEYIPATMAVPGAYTGPREARDSGDGNVNYLENLIRRRRSASPTQVPAAAVPQDPAVAPTQQAPPPAQPVPSAQPSQPQRAPARSDSPGISLSFTNAPVDNVVNAIMRELQYSYVIDPAVQGNVSLFTMGDIPRQDLFQVLEQVLKLNGISILKQDNLYVIVPASAGARVPHRILVQPEPSRKGRKGGPAANNSQVIEPQNSEPAAAEPGIQDAREPSSEIAPQGVTLPETSPEVREQLADEQGVITYLIPLSYVPTEHMLQMVQAFVSSGATVIDFAPSNLLLITDYRRNIEQVLNLVDLLDTQYFSINTVDLVPIRHNQAKDVAEDLGKVFAPGDRAGGVRIVAIERLNSIMVVTRAGAVLDEVRNWIERLDAPSTNTNIKTFVYQVENNTAMNIAEVLGQLYSDGMGLPSTVTGEMARDAAQQAGRQQQQREAGFVSPYDQVMRGPRAGLRSELGPSLTGRPMSSQPGIRAVVSGNVKIIVNEFNNSLIIQSTEADYSFLLQTIQQLDVLPRQVLIEAKVYSVELRDELSFGVAAFFEGREIPQPGPATTGQISGPSAASPGGALTLATRAIVGGNRQLEAIITALRSKTKVEVIEAPRLLAIDGMQAQINVGAEVPVTTGSFGDPISSGSPAAFLSTIQFRPTGTTLLIMPRISASGIVTMDLAIEVSSAVGTGLTPTINRNYVETSLIVQDGQTVAIAGIISDQLSSGRDRVPVLGDIPILGVLFGQTTRNARRAELIFLITPHVIRNLPTAVELTLDFRRALRNAHDTIEKREREEQDLIRRRREEDLKRESVRP